MKKAILSLALLASISFGLSAHGKDGGRRGGDRSKGLKELNLTAEQQEKMKALSAEFKKKGETLGNQQKDLRKEHRAALMAILTPEQQTKWKERVEQRSKTDHKAGKKNFARNGKGGKHMKLDAATTAKLKDLKADFLKEKKAVELSRIAPEAQKEKIQGLKQKYRTDRKAVINDRPQKGERRNS